MNGETLAQTLERQRLEHRKHRIEAVLRELHAEVVRAARGGDIPQALTSAVNDFHSSLGDVSARLDELSVKHAARGDLDRERAV